MATQILPEAETPLGMLGRVTGHIIPGRRGLGEVTVNIRGGSEAFLARADDPRQEFHVGEQVRVVDFQAPKTVFIERIITYAQHTVLER